MVSKNKNYIEIRPKSKLKYYFWSDPYRLPKDEETLQFFEQKNCEFVIALGKHTMNEKSYKKLQRLVDNKIGLNICLLDKDFAHLDNSHKFIELYKILRKSKIFNYVKEIYIDAEISNRYRRLSWNKKIAYILDSYPSKKEYQRAIDDYTHLKKLIHKDGKKMGIIRSITATHEVEKIIRNVPFKNINEDITVIMVYRVPEGKSKEYNDYWFYQIAKKEGDFIFLGDIKDGYQSLKKDITICSYLGKKRIYIYDYYGFQKSCKISDLKPLKYYKVKKKPFESIKNFTKIAGIEIADKFIKVLKLK
ncbi:MAG: hypothetical protein EU532_14675 [Promethearchaeota archaeon]|nr:MAG: hypothetical protein EU532_14675 [Candidatus Lokiarchaeota archaeon]